MNFEKVSYAPGLSTMTECMAEGLRINTNQLLELIASFDYAHFNREAADKGWTAGQVAEHLLLVDLSIIKVLNGRTAPIERDYQELINTISERMGNSDQKIEAPDRLIPSEVAKDSAALSEKILGTRKVLLQLVVTREINQSFPDSPHRIYGVMSGVEWINFLIHHCKRHIRQMEQLR